MDGDDKPVQNKNLGTIGRSDSLWKRSAAWNRSVESGEGIGTVPPGNTQPEAPTVAPPAVSEAAGKQEKGTKPKPKTAKNCSNIF